VSLVVRLKDEQEPVRGGVLRVRLEQLGEGGEEATTVGHVFNDLEKGRRKEGGRKEVSINISITVPQQCIMGSNAFGAERRRSLSGQFSVLIVSHS
jgi:hypothetical protein